jgi:16S rRNA G966 N2-methylase RsmD
MTRRRPAVVNSARDGSEQSAGAEMTLFDTLEPEAIETGILHRGDNLDRLTEFPSSSVDLIYLDPPFFSNRFYEVIWGDEAEVRSC